MGLDKSCENYLNGSVLVKPVYGWGWARLDAPEISVPAEIDCVPRPLGCEIIRFLYYRNMLNGAIGRIAESQHIYDGFWTFFYLHAKGLFNFTDELYQVA